jgi:hypothetical protein
MGFKPRLRALLSRLLAGRSFMVFAVACLARLVVWYLIPLDWNWDSYHHWQISYLSLKIGFPNWRLWDLNGCEYYWGIVPHLVQAFILGVLSTSSIIPLRAMNLVLGGLNAVLVYQIGSKYYSEMVGTYSGLLYGVFPVAAVFDILALQDTLALSFLLTSIMFVKERPFVAGCLLALTGQSRTELLPVSMIIVLLVLVAERFSTKIAPLLIGWLVVTGVFGWFVYTQTGNPLYSLYWSMYNVFGGWAEGSAGKPFIELMLGWVGWKLSAWLWKPTGWLIIGSVIASLFFFVYAAVKRPKGYVVPLAFLAALTILSPIFIPYIGSDWQRFLVMLRMANPLAATGLPLLVSLTGRVFKAAFVTGVRVTLLLAFLAGYLFLVPAYGAMQVDTVGAFEAADIAWGRYEGGNVVCDFPMMNYRFVDRWGVQPRSLLGNHYAPDYYGVEEPIEYARWLERNNVTIWIYSYDGGEKVQLILNRDYPGVLAYLDENPYAKIYGVDAVHLREILGSSSSNPVASP